VKEILYFFTKTLGDVVVGIKEAGWADVGAAAAAAADGSYLI